MTSKIASLIVRLTDDVSGPAGKAAGALKGLAGAGDGLSRLKAAASGLDQLGAKMRRARAEIEATTKELAAAEKRAAFFRRSKAAGSHNYPAFEASGEVAAAEARLKAAKQAHAAATRQMAQTREVFVEQKRTVAALSAGMSGAGAGIASLRSAETGLAGATAQANAALAKQPALLAAAASKAASLVKATRDIAAGMSESGRRTLQTIEANRRLVAGMSAPARAAARARQTEIEQAASLRAERADARKEALKTLGSVGALGLGHKVHEGQHAVLHTYREFDKERRFGAAVMGLSDAEQKPLVDQAIHMGATTKYNDVQVLEAQRELAARGLKKDAVMGLMSPAADLGMALDLRLPDAVKQMEGAIFGFQKPIGTLAEAMASARQTADVQVKAAKISGMTPEDISQAYKYGATPARMAGLSEQTLLAFAAISKKANMGGDEAGVAFRALVANALSPTRKAKEVMLANGYDYKNYQKNPDKIDTRAFVKAVAAQYGVQLDKKTTAGLDRIFTDKGMIADPSRFTPAVMDLLSDHLSGDDAKSKKSIAGLANRFRDASMKGVDANRLIQDLMKAFAGNPAFANAFFGSKQGGRIANAFGNPEEFRHMLKELLEHAEGYAADISKKRMAGYDGAMSRLEGATKNLETAFGRSWDEDGSGGFLTGLTDMAAKVVQGLAELPPAALQAGSALAWLTGKIATGAGTLGLLGAALSLRGSAKALTAAAGRLAVGGAVAAPVATAAAATSGLAAAALTVSSIVVAGAITAGAIISAKATYDQLPKMLKEKGPTSVDPATGGAIDENPMEGLGEVARDWWKRTMPAWAGGAAPAPVHKLSEGARDALAAREAAPVPSAPPKPALQVSEASRDEVGRRAAADREAATLRKAEAARELAQVEAVRRSARARQGVATIDPADLEQARRAAAEFRADPEGKRGREMMRRNAAEAASPAATPVSAPLPPVRPPEFGSVTAAAAKAGTEAGQAIADGIRGEAPGAQQAGAQAGQSAGKGVAAGIAQEGPKAVDQAKTLWERIKDVFSEGVHIPISFEGGAATGGVTKASWVSLPAGARAPVVRAAARGGGGSGYRTPPATHEPPGPAVSPQAAFGDGVDVARLPAGMRNNNPGNIKYVGQRNALGPSKNTDQGDPQAVYASPEDGMRALVDLARRKWEGGRRTVSDLIARSGGWTPGNHAAAANIARTAGVGAHDRIDLSDDETMRRFVRGLITQEHGPASRLYSDDLIRRAIRPREQAPAQEAKAAPEAPRIPGMMPGAERVNPGYGRPLHQGGTGLSRYSDADLRAMTARQDALDRAKASPDAPVSAAPATDRLEAARRAIQGRYPARPRPRLPPRRRFRA